MVALVPQSDKANLCDQIGAFSRTHLKQGRLIRKSFEYSQPQLIQEVNSLLDENYALEAHSLASATDGYWLRERLLIDFIRKNSALSYVDFLPGRVYTYRVLMNLIRRHVNVHSLIDVGCGSGMQLFEATRGGTTAIGIDRSLKALMFARSLQAQFGARGVVLYDGDALSGEPAPLLRADIVTNLGSLEHYGSKDQIKFLEYMASLAKGHVLVAVPNKHSRIFQVMENFELEKSPPANVYPDEISQHEVDFKWLASKLGWTVLAEGCFHIAATTLTDDIVEIDCYRRKITDEIGTDVPSSDAMLGAWHELEMSLSEEILANIGWFRFSLFKI